MRASTGQNTPDHWKMLESAFLQATERESQKRTQERVIEQTKAPFYFLKGAAKASLKLLEKGIQSKFSSWREQIDALSSPKKFLSTQTKKQVALQITAKNIYQNPRKFLTQISKGFKDQLTQKTIEFLRSPKEKQAEIVGSWAPPLALSWAGGQLGSLRISKSRSFSIKSNGKLPEGNGTWKDFSEIANTIGNGHAFEKHVLKRKEFPGVKTKQDLINHIERILKAPGEFKPLADGRFALWDETSKSVLIINPKTVDGGTIFVPKKGKYYFDEIIE